MTAELLLEDLTVEEAVATLREQNLITANNQLRAAVQPIVDNADAQGVHNLNVIYVDRVPVAADPYSFAREVVHELGGTTIIRSPGSISSASADFSRAAIGKAERGLLETPRDYPTGLKTYLTSLTDYTVPWTIYSAIVGLIIVCLFVFLTLHWLRTRPTR